MSEFEVTVRVEVKKPGDYSDRLTWAAYEVEVDETDLRQAAVVALRQAVGDAAHELGVNGGAA